MTLESLGGALTRGSGRHGHDPALVEPLMRRDLDVGADPEAAGVAPGRHGRQRVVGPDALVGIDHARQFADEQRAVVAQAQRKGARVGGMNLQVLGGDHVGIGDHLGLGRRHGDLALGLPGRRGDRRGRERDELALDLGQDGPAQRL